MNEPTPNAARALTDGHAARQRGDTATARRCYEQAIAADSNHVLAARARLAIAALDNERAPGAGRGRQALGLVMAGFIVGYLFLIVLPPGWNRLALVALLLCLLAGLVRAVQALATANLRTRLAGAAAIAIVVALFAGSYRYQGSQQRLDQAREAVALVAMPQRAVARIWRVTGALPDNNEQALLPAAEQLGGQWVERIQVGAAGRLEVTFDSELLAGQTLVFQPSINGDTLDWQCTGGSLESRARPPSCR